jgi:hypothetical protein
MNEERLWRYFSEVRAAVEAANQGQESQPYRRGTFMVTAVAGDVELTVSDVSEEDAVLIAGELKALGIRALVSGSVICRACGRRVPAQRYCVQCRARL